MDTTPLGFDNVLESPVILRNGIAASSTGEYVVSSAPGHGTYIEHKVAGGGKSIRISHETSEVVGFFGRDIDLVATASGDTLRIINLHRMVVVSTIKIRPGGLYVPRSGSSRHIGVVSPKGAAYMIDDFGEAHPTPLTVSQDYDVLWSSNAYPAGYTWNDEFSASIYIKSTPQDAGATMTSKHGINLFTVWRNPAKNRHEVFFSTYNEPHVLKRAWSEDGELIVDQVVAFPKGATVSDIALFSDGRPAVAAGFHHGKSLTEIIPPEKKLSSTLAQLMKREQQSVSATCVGALSYVSWTQTPITPAVPSITNYSIPGRPRYEIYEGRPRYTRMRTGEVTEYEVPRTNKTHQVDIPGKKGLYVYYRWVSPLPTEGYMSDTALLIVDRAGMVSAGEYSPTVKMCYDLGIPVAIMPVMSDDTDTIVEDTTMDIMDVADHIKSQNYAKDVVVMAEGELTRSALEALSRRNTPIRNVMLYHTPDDIFPKRQKKRSSITVVCDRQEDADVVPEGITTKIVKQDNREDVFLSLVDIISGCV